MYTNQRVSSRKTPHVVSRLFQHSPRQLRIARERLDKAELYPPVPRQPADPHSIGREKNEAEVKPPKPGHGSTRYIPVASDLVGSGAVVEPRFEERQRESREVPHVKSSLQMENGFLQTISAEQHHLSRRICEGSALGSQGHLIGGSATQHKPSRSSIMPGGDDVWWDSDDALFNRPQRGTGDPSFGAAHIQSVQDFLGEGSVEYKPARRQIEHPGAEMHVPMQGPPAVLDLHGRPWVQKQRQHFDSRDIAARVDHGVAFSVKEVAESFRFEEHTEVTTKRVPKTQGVHPISADFPLPAPETVPRQPRPSGGGGGAQYIIDPFGKLSVCNTASSQSKRVERAERAAPAPWESEANVDSVMIDRGCKSMVSADRLSACTGIWSQRRHASPTNPRLDGSMAAVSMERPPAQAPWELQSSDQTSPMAFMDDIRAGHATAQRMARPTRGRGTTPERARPGGLGASGSPWLAGESMEYEVSAAQDWLTPNPDHYAGKRRNRRKADSVVLSEGAAGKAVTMDGTVFPASGHLNLRDPSHSSPDRSRHSPSPVGAQLQRGREGGGGSPDLDLSQDLGSVSATITTPPTAGPSFDTRWTDQRGAAARSLRWEEGDMASSPDPPGRTGPARFMDDGQRTPPLASPPLPPSRPSPGPILRGGSPEPAQSEQGGYSFGGGVYSSGTRAAAGISMSSVWAANRRKGGQSSFVPSLSLNTSQQGPGQGRNALKPPWWGDYDPGSDPAPPPGAMTPAHSTKADRRRGRSATPQRNREFDPSPAPESDTWFKGGRRASFTDQSGQRVHKNASTGNILTWDADAPNPNPQLTPRSGRKLMGTQARNMAQWDIDSCQKGRRLSLDSQMNSHRGGYGAVSAPFGVDLR